MGIFYPKKEHNPPPRKPEPPKPPKPRSPFDEEDTNKAAAQGTGSKKKKKKKGPIHPDLKNNPEWRKRYEDAIKQW